MTCAEIRAGQYLAVLGIASAQFAYWGCVLSNETNSGLAAAGRIMGEYSTWKM